MISTTVQINNQVSTGHHSFVITQMHLHEVVAIYTYYSPKMFTRETCVDLVEKLITNTMLVEDTGIYTSLDSVVLKGILKAIQFEGNWVQLSAKTILYHTY